MSTTSVTIGPSELAGTIPAIASKSVAHRLILLAALTDSLTEVDCATTSADIQATISCVEALGAQVAFTPLGFRVTGVPGVRTQSHSAAVPTLDCGESGSTLRFLLPVVAALGCGASFVGHGRLAQRPLSPLYEQLAEHSVRLSAQGSFPLKVTGRLTGGTFVLPGNVSSQYISGLLMAAPLCTEPVRVLVSKPVESEPYVRLTIRALAAFGVAVAQGHETVDGVSYRSYDVTPTTLVSPQATPVEGDWSNAAFWLAAGALSHTGTEVTGLDSTSTQGDRAILAALALFGARVSRTRGSAGAVLEALHGITLDVSNIPDLVPPLAAVATHAEGVTRLTNAARLRLKESDRLATVTAAITKLGGQASVEGDDLVIVGGPLRGGIVDAANDHRIAMMAAILASHAEGPITICGSSCVEKSYPDFWKDYVRLGGTIIARTEE